MADSFRLTEPLPNWHGGISTEPLGAPAGAVGVESSAPISPPAHGSQKYTKAADFPLGKVLVGPSSEDPAKRKIE